jgi:hypothetical protein
MAGRQVPMEAGALTALGKDPYGGWGNYGNGWVNRQP